MQNPIPAYAYGQDPDSHPKLIQVDANGNIVPFSAVPSADSTADAQTSDVVGNKSDAAVAAVGTTASLMAYLKSLVNSSPAPVVTGAAVISNGLSLFTISGGPIQILSLLSICQTANDATASTLQYQSAGTLGGTTQTISGATATLASAAIGTSVIFQGTALATAPLINVNGAGIAANGLLVVPAGSLKAVVGVGSTTGTWKHYLRYTPLAPGAVVTAAF